MNGQRAMLLLLVGQSHYDFKAADCCASTLTDSGVGRPIQVMLQPISRVYSDCCCRMR